ncbi:MAG: adenylate/guanylate cyclase domain-containing protein [Chitinophagales bacterium]
MEELKVRPVKELQEMLVPGETSIRQTDILNALALKLQHTDAEHCRQLCLQAMEMAGKLDYQAGHALASLTFSWILPDSAQSLNGSISAMERLQKAGKKRELLSAIRQVTLLYRKTGDLENAESYGRKLIQHSVIEFPEYLGSAYNLLATVLIGRGKYAEALQLMLEALTILEANGDVAEVAMACSNLCALYFSLENFEKALEYAKRSRQNYKIAHMPMVYADALLAEAQVHSKMKNIDEALACFEESLELAEQLGYKSLEAEIFPNLGTLHFVRGKYTAAKTYLLKGLELCDNINFLQPRILALISLGNLYGTPAFAEYDYKPSEKYLLEALELAKANGMQWEIREAHFCLAELYERKSEWQRAFQHHKAYTETDKEIGTSESRNKLMSFEVEKQLAITVNEKEVTERILNNILPRQIADRIKMGEEEIIERYEQVTVLFADIVGFTNWSKGMPVHELAKHLNRLFQLFDALAVEHGVEKIKTIGDAYMCVAGLPVPCTDHAERIAQMAIAMNNKIRETYPAGEVRLRIGLHSGEVVAGVLGKNKYVYDLWGDTVNTASRMESHGIKDRIQVSEEVKDILKDKFSFEKREEVEVKGKGKMTVYILNE